MQKENETIIKSDYHHIDNGGITVSVIDKGVDGGVVLQISAEYYGYPGIVSEIRLSEDAPGPAAWLEKVGVMLIAASQEVKKIDWSKRYDK